MDESSRPTIEPPPTPRNSAVRLALIAAVVITAIPLGLFTMVVFVFAITDSESEHPFPYQQLPLPVPPPPPETQAFVRLEGGTFTIGAPDRDTLPGPRVSPYLYYDARPQVTVTVPPFEMAVHEVTAEDYCVFLNHIREADSQRAADAYVHSGWNSTITFSAEVFTAKPGLAHAPAVGVPFAGAVAYGEWLSTQTDTVLRLPTEWEWEFAARGTEGRTYPWGEASPVGRAFIWQHYRQALPVSLGVWRCGAFPEGATPEGIHDLLGNAPEWCANHFYDLHEWETSAGPIDHDLLLRRPVRKVVYRGNGIANDGVYGTGWTRWLGGPVTAPVAHDIGFRLVREIID